MEENVFDELEWRGLINQTTDANQLKKRLEKPIVLYCGFDVTADSLHIGHLLPLITLKRLVQYNHKIIAVLGSATSLIGDPSGKKSERKLQTEEIVQTWRQFIKKQLTNLFKEEAASERVVIVENSEWLKKLNLLSFIRDIGKHFSLGYMLAKESVKSRLEVGISFTEFSYMLLQAYDFWWLYKNYSCELQIGGSDQWGNITAGIDLIQKLENKEAYGLTVPLLLKSDGTKFGKTEGGAIWLDASKTSVYQFYQFLINTDDRDVIHLLKFLTFLTPEEIKQLEEEVKTRPQKRLAQKTLARELTKLVHSEKALERAEKISEALFYNNLKKLSAKELKEGLNNVPTTQINNKKELGIVDFLVETKVCPSKRQAREDINNGAISLNGEVIKNINLILCPKNSLIENIFVVRRGKKDYYLIFWQ